MDGVYVASVRYEFSAWTLDGLPDTSGLGYMSIVVDEVYGDTAHTAMERAARKLRRYHKNLDRMEITCHYAGLTRVFGYNV